MSIRTFKALLVVAIACAAFNASAIKIKSADIEITAEDTEYALEVANAAASALQSAFSENQKTLMKVAKFAEALGPIGDVIGLVTFFLPSAEELAMEELNDKID